MSQHHRNAGWATQAKRLRPILAASLPAPCGRCGRVIEPGDKFDIGHIIDLAAEPDQIVTPDDVRPEHPGCSRRAGGRQGARITNRRKYTDRSTDLW